LWLTERVTRYSIGVTMPCGYAGDAMLGGLVNGQRRRCLGYQSPSALYAAATVQ
jgi:hypothetical protein